MLWRDGLHLTNEGKNMLSNNFLQYLKNVPLGDDDRIFTDWQTNQGRAKGSHIDGYSMPYRLDRNRNGGK